MVARHEPSSGQTKEVMRRFERDSSELAEAFRAARRSFEAMEAAHERGDFASDLTTTFERALGEVARLAREVHEDVTALQAVRRGEGGASEPPSRGES